MSVNRTMNFNPTLGILRKFKVSENVYSCLFNLRFAKMETATELVLLNAIEARKDVIVSKQNTKEMRIAKKKAWKEIHEIVFVETGQVYSEGKLAKKWSNIQIRVKDTLRDGKQTGGGPRRSYRRLMSYVFVYSVKTTRS